MDNKADDGGVGRGRPFLGKYGRPFGAQGPPPRVDNRQGGPSSFSRPKMSGPMGSVQPGGQPVGPSSRMALGSRLGSLGTA